MKITMTNGEIVAKVSGINKILQGEKPLPARANYAINRNIARIQEVLEAYHATLAEINKTEEEEEKTRKLNELLSVENELELQPIQEVDIPDGLSAGELNAIFFMVVQNVEQTQESEDK